MSSLGHMYGILTTDLGLNYQFGEYLPDGDSYPETFWVGEYYESEVTTEDGMSQYDLVLTGTVFGMFGRLEADKKKIKDKFILGYRSMIPEGSIYVNYGGMNFVPSQDPGIKRAEVTLSVQEWKVY